MMQPAGHHLAELNVGRLLAPPDDPRVAEFMAAIDRVNGIGRRSPGFVWMLEGSGGPDTGATEHAIGGDPRYVPNLTVWEDVASFESFVWQTVHSRFYQRRGEWFEPAAERHFVMWWVPAGHRPTLEEALARLDHLRAHGDSDHAFGWAHLPQARLWRERNCAAQAV